MLDDVARMKFERILSSGRSRKNDRGVERVGTAGHTMSDEVNVA